MTTPKRPRAAKMGPLGGGEEEKTKRRNGVIMVVAATVLVVAAAVGGILLLVTNSDDEPTTVARKFTGLYQRGLNSSGRDVDASEFEPLACKEIMPQLREAFSAKENPVVGAPQFALTVKDVKTEGDKGTFTMSTKVTMPGTQDQSSDESFKLVKEDGDWRVCGL